jgi:hypothetical protein
MNIEVPEDVTAYVKQVFGNCNENLAEDISTFPAIHEESLDMNLISNFG